MKTATDQTAIELRPRVQSKGQGTASLETFRVELTGYCYRMLGSVFDAEDAVQDTMLRAWRGLPTFEGRSSLRSWLYRIATHVCLSTLTARKRRASPMDLGPSASADTPLGAPLDESTWIEPIPDALVLPSTGDPAQQLLARESLRLAFVAALQLLPPRQRAALILHDVLQWQASEVGALLETSTTSVHSALQRARETLTKYQRERGLRDVRAGGARDDSQRLELENSQQRSLLDRYVAVFERFDVDGLVALLHEDATLSMPPFALWLRGASEIARFWRGPGSKCAGSRLVRLSANASPALAQYKPNATGTGHSPFALHVLDVHEDRILAQHSFLMPTRLFPLFEVPLTAPAN